MHSRLKKKFYKRLDGSYKEARLCYISRKALVAVAQSPWIKLLFNGDDRMFITATGFNFKMIRILHDKYGSQIQKRGSKRGRKRLLTSEDYLGLVLLWTRTRGSLWCLSLIFGCTLSPLKRYLHFRRYILLHALKQDTNIDIKLLKKEDQLMEMVKSIGYKYPLLKDEKVFAAMDNVKLYLEQSSDHAVQNAFYNGWKHDHYVLNFFFTPDGMICCMNDARSKMPRELLLNVQATS
eukprot:15365205-Ditylum_brightwellii.AAC.1